MYIFCIATLLQRTDFSLSMCMWVFCLHVCLSIMYIQCLSRPKGDRPPGTEVRDIC